MAGVLAVSVATTLVILPDYRAHVSGMDLICVPLFSLLSECMLLLSAQPGILNAIFASSALRHLGIISYGAYVYHLLFRKQFDSAATWLLPRANANEHLVLLFAVAALGTLALASLSYYTFERSCLNLKEGWASNA